MRPSKIFISICAVISLCCVPQAQAQVLPSVSKSQTTHIEVGVDALGVVQRWLSSYGQYEAAVRLNIKDKYFPIAEIGVGDAEKEETTSKLRYTTSAPYGRLGADINVLRDKHDDYRVYVGIRAAYTSFKYDVESLEPISDPVWGTGVSVDEKDVSCSYLWAELVAGVQAHLVGPVHLGWTLRYKNRLHQSYGDVGEPWYVPGFGKRGSSRLGGSFNIIIAF